MNAHPNYDVNQPFPFGFQELLQNPQLVRAHGNQLAALLPPQPTYTCPTCRKEVKHKPVEDFSLKSVVRTVAQVVGETSPQKPQGQRRPTDGPWDGFFPPGR